LSLESWAQYSPQGDALYYLREEDGQDAVLRQPLDGLGMPQGEPVTLGGDLGSIRCLQVTPQGLYLTSNRAKKIYNVYRMGLDGKDLTQMTDTYADVLDLSVSPGGSALYACLYQKGQVSLYAFREDALSPRPAGAPDNAPYLADDFSQAARIIPASAPPPVPTPVWRDAGAPPAAAPPAPGSLEVVQATNLVQLKWAPDLRDDQPVEDYRVYRATGPGALFHAVGKTDNGSLGFFNDFEVEPGVHYFYYVTAENAAGESGPSAVVDAIPESRVSSHDYGIKLTPDILLFLAGYDSSFGFVGGGVVQLSDYLGDHRLSIVGNSIPTVQTGFQLGYEFSQWRTTVDLDLFYYQNFLQIYDLQTGNIVNQYRDNENGFALNFTYPLDTYTRVEYGLGTQRFQGNPLYLQFSEGISNYFQDADRWNVANFYRLAYIKDHRRGTQFWPQSGYSYNLTL
ncbi:MAG TPA: hypothetical protein VFR02_08430, partial [bacterium]|nr:hypothetical protein [bacterium]